MCVDATGPVSVVVVANVNGANIYTYALAFPTPFGERRSDPILDHNVVPAVEGRARACQHVQPAVTLHDSKQHLVVALR